MEYHYFTHDASFSYIHFYPHTANLPKLTSNNHISVTVCFAIFLGRFSHHSIFDNQMLSHFLNIPFCVFKFSDAWASYMVFMIFCTRYTCPCKSHLKKHFSYGISKLSPSIFSNKHVTTDWKHAIFSFKYIPKQPVLGIASLQKACLFLVYTLKCDIDWH